MRELQQLRLLRELEPARAGEIAVPARRDCAPRNDSCGYAARDDRAGCASREAWAAYEAQHEQAKRADCERLLLASAAAKGGRTAGYDRAKQSQFAGAETTANSVPEKELGEKCANDASAKTKPISERRRRNETANAGAIAM
jgi:hypothetical protein